MTAICSSSTYQTTTLRHTAMLRSTKHFRSTEYTHRVMGHLHQHTNYYMLLDTNAQSLRVKQY